MITLHRFLKIQNMLSKLNIWLRELEKKLKQNLDFVSTLNIFMIFFLQNWKKNVRFDTHCIVLRVAQCRHEWSAAVWPEGGNFPVLWDFWPKRGDRFLRMGNCGINSKRGGFWRISQKIGKFSYFSTKCWHFCLKIS